VRLQEQACRKIQWTAGEPPKELAMLVLSRQRDQSIVIGDDIEITIVDVRGDKVRIGINAPRHVSVHRKEVYEAIRRENEAAAGNGQKTPTPAEGAPETPSDTK
jgi:carbon storage regulator